MQKMPCSVLLRCCLALLVVTLMLVDDSGAILTQQRGRPRKGPAPQPVYKYLRGYYQDDKSAQASAARRRYTHERRVGLSDGVKRQPPGKAKSYGTTYIQPKSGLQSGRYRFAQSPDYIQKLKRLAVLLKARAAARNRRKPGVRGYPAPPPPPPPLQQQQPPRQPQLQSPQGYRRQPAPRSAPAQFVAQPSYPAPQAPPPSSYGSPQSAPSPPGYGGQTNGNPSFQSLGLPSVQTYQQPQPQPQPPYLPVPVTTPRPARKVSSEALVRLLKASYASLMPLLLNQVKMSSYGVQSIPLYGSNPYSVFGPMTYGPLPKPSISSQMSLSYSPQAFSSAQARPVVSGYGANSQPSGYGANSQPTGYGAGTQATSGLGYGSSQSFDISADSTCGPISGMFCNGRASGLYSHPASSHCFVQCDHVGKGVGRSCSPGTFWKALGPEPALFNYCS